MTTHRFVVVVAAAFLGGGLLTVLVCGTPLWARGDVSKEVKARKFTVVDAAGEERAVLTATPGTTALGLYDQAGKSRASLFVTPSEGPILPLSDDKEEVLWSAP